MSLQTNGRWFIDEKGRKILLRGVNLGGSTKMPTVPDGATHNPTDFSDHREVSFINRPFPLEEAEEHFSRLQHWGFNTLRLLTTWEAIEHEGPGKYDTTYLDYFTKIVEIAGDYGFYVFIDPHQDVWSRMTGGDGAPGWTFEKAGLNFSTFVKNGTAKVMQYHYPENYDQMEWFLNYKRFSVATMFTLFFGSEDFAPNATINGESIQSYLQSHFTNAILEVAKRIKDFDHVIGFDSLNEPDPGFIGIKQLDKFPDRKIPGVLYSPFDALVTGSGFSRPARRYEQKLLWIQEVGQEILNPDGISSWIDEGGDIWKNHGIFEIENDQPILKKPDYFAYKPDGTPVEFFHDYLRPFAVDYIKQIREKLPDSLLFVEGAPEDPVLSWKETDPKGLVNASHWYDGYTLFTKTYRRWLTVDVETVRPVIFRSNVHKYLKKQLSLRGKASELIGNVPTLIGEFGIPYDMNGAKAYETGNFSDQIHALDDYYDILDELQYHSTQWNYTSDNSNKWGDLWNMEDLSIFSRDQQSKSFEIDINSGGRAIAGFCRPYPRKTSGTPIFWKFDQEKGRFQFQYKAQPGITLVYLPRYQFPKFIASVSYDLPYNYNKEKQILSIDTTEFPKNRIVNLTVNKS